MLELGELEETEKEFKGLSDQLEALGDSELFRSQAQSLEAEIQFAKGKLELDAKMLQRPLAEAIARSDPQSMSTHAIPLSDVYIELKEYQHALEALDSAIEGGWLLMQTMPRKSIV